MKQHYEYKVAESQCKVMVEVEAGDVQADSTSNFHKHKTLDITGTQRVKVLIMTFVAINGHTHSGG